MSVLFDARYTVTPEDPTDVPDLTWTLPTVSFPTSAQLPPPFSSEEYVSGVPTVTNSVAQPNIVWTEFPTVRDVYSVSYNVTLLQTFTMACDSDLVITFNFEDAADSAGNILPTVTGGSGVGSEEMSVAPESDTGHFFWDSTGELEVTMGCDKCYRSGHVGGGGGGQGGGKNQNPNSIGN
jgi:hypothetical protein